MWQRLSAIRERLFNRLTTQSGKRLKDRHGSPQTSSSVSGIAHPAGSWRGEGHLCNTDTVEMILRYQVERKVSTPAAIDRCSPFHDSDYKNAARPDSTVPELTDIQKPQEQHSSSSSTNNKQPKQLRRWHCVTLMSAVVSYNLTSTQGLLLVHILTFYLVFALASLEGY